ncbi:MAG: LacI family DNA-binding transcriptional regulator, partial [Draconibacterium sp.]
MQKVSITDIAEMTGLSTTTVSRVLSGQAKQYRIGKQSQEKVREAAKKLHYVPNHFAANLRTGRSSTLAVIIPSLNNPFFAGLASELNTE